jgi:hypothetical protein
MKILLGILLSILVSACSTFSKKECENFDWHSKGYDAAMDGEPEFSRLSYFQKECGEKHDVQPNKQMFDVGYNKGLDYLCTSSGGRVLGQKGNSYQSICPKEKEEEFLKGYKSGRLDFLEQRVVELEQTVRKLKSDLSDCESRLYSCQSTARTCNP